MSFFCFFSPRDGTCQTTVRINEAALILLLPHPAPVTMTAQHNISLNQTRNAPLLQTFFFSDIPRKHAEKKGKKNGGERKRVGRIQLVRFHATDTEYAKGTRVRAQRRAARVRGGRDASVKRYLPGSDRSPVCWDTYVMEAEEKGGGQEHRHQPACFICVCARNKGGHRSETARQGVGERRSAKREREREEGRGGRNKTTLHTRVAKPLQTSDFRLLEPIQSMVFLLLHKQLGKK